MSLRRITDDCLTDHTVNKLERLVVLDLSFTFVSNLGRETAIMFLKFGMCL